MIASAPQPGVLHLVSAPSAMRGHRASTGRLLPTYLCARAIEQGLTPPGQVLLIGDPESEAYARSVGLRVDQRLAPPLGRVSMLTRQVRNMSRQFTRVICWNDELAPLLRRLHCRGDLISTRPDLAQPRVTGKIDVRVFERSDRVAWEARNHQAEIDTVLSPIIRNPHMPAGGPSRESLEIERDSLCIGVIADRPSDIDARAIGFLMGLLQVSGFKLTAVIPQGASHLMSARRHHHGLGSPFRLLLAQSPIITMLPLFDVLVHPCYDGSGAAQLIERLCENNDTPVLRLRNSDRDGLSRAPSVAGPIIEALDDILAQRSLSPLRREVHEHV